MTKGRLISIIRALKIGNRAAEILCAQSGILKVHSIFQHAVNFINDGDYIVTILENRHGCSSQTITITIDDMANLSSGRITEGEHIIFEGLFNFDTVSVTHFKLPEKIEYSSADLIKKSINACTERLETYGNLSGFAASILGRESIYSKYIIENMHALKHAYFNLDKNEISSALKGFIGLGPGLTPSGDDFICGFISVLYYCSGITGMDHNWTRDIGNRVIEGADSKTTIVSYNMLRAYLKGELSEHMQSLLRSILTSKNHYFEKDFERILQIGSTSGSDMASGVLFGLKLMGQILG